MKLEDLKVGQYVRLKDKRNITYIRKVREIPQDNRYASIYLDKEANYSKGLSLKNIIKASYDIIDILEKGDYVNGSRVVKINCNFEYVDDDADTGVNEVDNGLILENNSFIYFGSEITSIVTKEQFEQMSYKVGE